MSETAAGTRLTKSTLVTVSHAIERAALASAEDGPLAVIALFQRLPYFERERAVYEQIAKHSAVAVVGVVADRVPDLPAGPHAVTLDEQEDLAREWAVVVLTPRFGAVLVAYDREEVEAGHATLESGRLFDGWWRFRRDDALHEMIRLRRALGDRLPPAARSAIDDVVARVRELPPAPGESRADASVRMLVDRSERDRARLRELRRPDTAPDAPGDGLTSEAGIRRWTGTDGVTASGTLPVALLGIRVEAPGTTTERWGRRAAALQREGLVGVLTALLRPADRATRIGDDEYLLVLPALPYDEALALAYRVGIDLAAAAERNPFLAVRPTVAVGVTRDRPLPVDRIHAALDWAVAEGVPVATLNES
ncbi:MAG TPA: DICT sensory domain-containing protein [Actinoplanes sp.]|nr:DICT sensory domain-containing protein [Actinoplanes sp.]